MKLVCEKFENTSIVLGVYKFKNHGNCTLNNQTLDNAKLYNKELIFENTDVELKTHQISNKTLELKQIQNQDILFNEIPLIQIVNKRNNDQIVFNVMMITLILKLIIIICKKPLFALAKRVKSKQKVKELSNNQPVSSAQLNSTRVVQIGIPRERRAEISSSQH